MTIEQLLGWFIGAGAFGWVTLFGLIAWLGNSIYKTVEGMRGELHDMAKSMLPRDEFSQRHTELVNRIDYAHKRIDDFWATTTDPGLGGFPVVAERRKKPRETE